MADVEEVVYHCFTEFRQADDAIEDVNALALYSKDRVVLNNDVDWQAGVGGG